MEIVSDRTDPQSAVPAQPVRFTYAHEGQSWARQWVIRSIEAASGRRHFQRLYDDWAASGAGGNPFDVVVRLFRFQIELAGTSLADVPKTGGLLIVANHPFGIADGLALGWLATQLRRDVRILTHSLLCAVPEFQPYLLPVDFAETQEARRSSAITRRMAADLLSDGGAVVIFPGGSVATSNRPFRRPAVELPWHPFVARLATRPNTTVLPVHVHGQNSGLFHVASHLSYALRIALMFHETRRRVGRALPLTLGAPLSQTDLAAWKGAEIADALRQRCLALGQVDSTEVFAWPSHIRW